MAEPRMVTLDEWDDDQMTMLALRPQLLAWGEAYQEQRVKGVRLPATFGRECERLWKRIGQMENVA